MTEAMWGAIGSLLLIIIGLWKYFSGKKAERRKLADEAQRKLKEGQDNHDNSSVVDSWNRVNRL